MTFLQSVEEFDSQKNGRGRIYPVAGADNYLGFKTFVEMLREKIDYFRNQHVTGLAIILLVPIGLTNAVTLKESFFTLKWERPHKTHWRNLIRKLSAAAKNMHMDEDKDGNPIQGLFMDGNLERCTSAVTGMTKARGEAALLVCAASHNKIPLK